MRIGNPRVVSIRLPILLKSFFARSSLIRDALELITDERNRFNKSLATLIREKGPQKVRKAEGKTG